LILLVVGSVNKDRISNFKRTGNYTIADYELLISFIDNFDKIITTPHVLSQTSDLTVLSGKEFGSARYSRS